LNILENCVRHKLEPTVLKGANNTSK